MTMLGKRKIQIPAEIIEYKNSENYIQARVERSPYEEEMEWWVVEKNNHKATFFTSRVEFREYLIKNGIPILL